MKFVEVQFEASKPARNCIQTARRKGMKGLDEWSYMDAYSVPYEKAFTNAEQAEDIRTFRENNNLSLAYFVEAGIIELDSSNMSHAGAYYCVTVKVREDEAKKAELI